MAGADLPREPPPEAERQADDTYMLSLEDGSTVRWTRRPNGTWRPPERTRAGWVGELERPKYVTPALRERQDYPAGYVPGLPPEPAAPSKARPQSAGRISRMPPQDFGHVPGMMHQEAEPAVKAKRKPGRRKPGEAKQAERPASQPGRVREEPRHEPPQHSLRLLENAVQGLRKEASQVRSLKASAAQRCPEDHGPKSGAPAEEAHPVEPAPRQPFAPPQRRHEPPQALVEPAPRQPVAPPQRRHEAAQALPVFDDGDLPMGNVDEGELADAVDRLRIADGGRRKAAAATPALVKIRERKAILKKLRQVLELEEKQARGEELNEDQLAKLRSRVELQSALLD